MDGCEQYCHLSESLRKAVESPDFAAIKTSNFELREKAQGSHIFVAVMGGKIFAVSNGGIFGSLNNTPIADPRQLANLGPHGTFESLRIQISIEAWDHDFLSHAEYIGSIHSIVLIDNITIEDIPLKIRQANKLSKNKFKFEVSMRKECNPGFFGSICQHRVDEPILNCCVYCPHSGHLTACNIHIALYLRAQKLQSQSNEEFVDTNG
ncbi:hypothetical protein Aperf_G00000035875 [Anoplocephala perfoliata]